MLQDLIKLLSGYALSIIPAFLFALLISAVLAEVIPDTFFEKILSSKGILLVLLASITGALIPLCTCGMIPLASKLQKKGTSWLIVISFLTAGNASSITSIFLTLILGLKIAVLRFLFSVIFGILVSYIFVLIFKPVSILPMREKVPDHNNKLSILKKIFREFLGLLYSFGPWVFTAIFVAAILSLFLQPKVIESFAGTQSFFAPFLFSIIGFPFYFCAGTDIPISSILLAKGAGLGNVLVFMTTSPGVNLTSSLVYQKWLGIKNTITYLLISALVCGVMGLILNKINIF